MAPVEKVRGEPEMQMRPVGNKGQSGASSTTDQTELKEDLSCNI